MIQQPKINNTEPSLKDVLDAHKKDIFFTLNTHAIATIESFDPENQTCVAKINYDKMLFVRDSAGVYKPTAVKYPILTDVPVVFLNGGKAGLTMPVKKGDQALIVFNDRDFSNWNEGANSGFVASLRMHSLSDGIAIVGLHRKTAKISGFDSENPNLYNDKAGVKVTPQKVKVYNDVNSLGPLLQELITDIKNLVTATAAITVTCAAPGSPSSTPNNIAAINAVTGQLTTVANKLQGLLE